jgi:protein SCO1/2
MRIQAVCVTLALSLASWSVSYSQAMNPAARAFSEVGIDQKLNEQVPLDLTFRDEENREVTLGSFFHNRPVILSLVYYKCPMLCTQVLNGMVETFKTIEFRAGSEFEVVTVSIDPSESYDLAAEKKASYIEKYGREGVDGGWHFLVGGQEAISRLAEAVGFRYVYDERTGQFAHASGIMVATPEGKLARYLYGIEYGAKDLTFSLMEASQERIGSPVDKLLLLCYHYDPMTGKYGVVVANLLRGGGVLTVILVASYVVVNVRRERRKAKQTQRGGL